MIENSRRGGHPIQMFLRNAVFVKLTNTINFVIKHDAYIISFCIKISDPLNTAGRFMVV